jgi:hypothetical protein
MFLDDVRSIKSSRKDLRKFGLTLGVFFALLAGYFRWRHGGAGTPALATVSGFFLFFGLLAPSALKPVQKAWMTMALAMGWVMTRVLLSLLYFVAVTPIGLIMRRTGHDLLGTKKKAESYWQDCRPRTEETYSYQF